MIAEHRKWTAKQVREIEESLGAGKATSFEDYKRLCGLIQGLKQSSNALDDLARKHLENGDYE